ncbi:MAG: hypothetical protein WDM86_17790 [Rhizomicrobium sp.]
MSPTIYLLTLGVLFGTILAVFGMKYLASARVAQSRILAEDTYRALAEKAVVAQAGGVSALLAVQADLAEIKTRLTAVEKILKEVG